MTVRIAKQEDFNVLDEALKETAKRLKRKGSTQWAHILTNEEASTLKMRLSKGEVLIIEEGPYMVGMCYLYEEPNEWDYSLWQKETESGNYYLHKVVVRDLFVGKQYGQKILKEVINWVKSHQGQRILLDCKADVAYLNEFYQKSGFKFVSSRYKGEFEELFADFNLYEYLIHQ
ncbi:GNAT family N-acetyltransferase [Vagococcus sp. DIV0080]|uniref:GNAT family N-acetyltransferase n=1 Tax=Candidatus Vagococcus giribetii TaxID=2230876 RepID=A0ABS3HRL5_9ENTE|nr:GNAT family N-acetyltransferase [Vagococcus sp. DIV0080]MBO0476397.1 GNAT family N-acetyltransferase [Vagococcus sp. DIV0080]